MAYKGCSDCGCRLSNGICSNCDEELYIETYQGEFMSGVTEDWEEKVAEQKDRANQRLKQERQQIKSED